MNHRQRQIAFDCCGICGDALATETAHETGVCEECRTTSPSAAAPGSPPSRLGEAVKQIRIVRDQNDSANLLVAQRAIEQALEEREE